MKPLKKRNSWSTLRQNIEHLNYDWGLILVVTILCLFGLAVLASSLSTQSPESFQQEFFKQLFLGVGLGGVGCFFLARLDYHEIIKRGRLILLINFGLLSFIGVFAIYLNLAAYGLSPSAAATFKDQFIQSLSFLPIRPHIAYGAVRWIDLPVLPNFQPSEFTKLALLIYFASKIDNLQGKPITWLSLKNPFYAFLLSSALIVVQPDLGTILLIFGILVSAMWSAKVPTKILAYSSLVILIFGLIMTFTVNYRVSRVLAFLDPNSESAGQIRGVQSAIQNGGLFGKGYGQSEFKQQTGILFEYSTDGIIAIIGEEMGFIGVVIFLGLYLVFLWKGLNISNKSPDLAGKALATGVTIWIVSQAYLNIMGMLSLLPLKGVPLPFVSQGGSSIMINLLALGILINISSQRIQVKSPIAEKPFAQNKTVVMKKPATTTFQTRRKTA